MPRWRPAARSSGSSRAGWSIASWRTRPDRARHRRDAPRAQGRDGRRCPTASSRCPAVWARSRSSPRSRRGRQLGLHAKPIGLLGAGRLLGPAARVAGPRRRGGLPRARPIAALVSEDADLAALLARFESLAGRAPTDRWALQPPGPAARVRPGARLRLRRLGGLRGRPGSRRPSPGSREQTRGDGPDRRQVGRPASRRSGCSSGGPAGDRMTTRGHAVAADLLDDRGELRQPLDRQVRPDRCCRPRRAARAAGRAGCRRGTPGSCSATRICCWRAGPGEVALAERLARCGRRRGRRRRRGGACRP